jgi:hypothetical protein
MTLFWNVLAQVVVVGINGLNAFAPFIPPQKLAGISVRFSAIQAAVAVVAHHYNTDGTPQAMPFVPAPK